MFLSPNINDIRRAGEEWLEKKLAEEEINLPDYERPLKTITEKGKSPFQSQVARYGFMNAITRNLLP